MLLTYRDLAVGAVSLSLAYWICLAVYRLYFSPLAKVPGPKLAALTLWYEFYYDVIKRGRYTWKIAEMHERYGPIVRISPYELHINDPEYYDELYAGSSRRTEKYYWAIKGFGETASTFGTIGHERHRTRRSAVAPYFSKASVYQLEPLVQGLVDKLVSRLESLRGSGNVVNLIHVFVALTADVIVQYTFAKPYGFIDSPGFAPHWHKAIMDVCEIFHSFKQFGWMEPIMRSIPPSIVEKINPQLGALAGLESMVREQVIGAKDQLSQGKKPEGQKTVLYDLLTNGQLAPEDKTVKRLQAEGLSIFAAGSMTVAHTLSCITFHVIHDKEMLGKLQAELKTVMPHSDSQPKYNQLEQLPYLTAVIQEGLRWGYGVSYRLQRISPNTALQYDSYTIPPGTPVGMTSVLMHDNPTIFPYPRTFSPDRWLQPSSNELKRYLVAFSKGSRQCLGMNLAYCELYLTLAAIFAPGRFTFELYETGPKDVEIVHDFFVAEFSKESKGIRVLVE